MTDDYSIIENLKISRYICKFQIIYDRKKLMPKFVVILPKYDSESIYKENHDKFD